MTESYNTNYPIIQSLIRSISAGTLPPGSRLPTEQQLAEHYSISRSSVRESLKVLQFLGILNCTHGSGYKVSDNFYQSFSTVLKFLLNLQYFTYKDISDLREALEIKTLMLIQKNSVAPSVLRDLRQCIRDMEQRDLAIYADIRFHNILAQYSGNNLICSIALALADACTAYMRLPWENISDTDAARLIQAHAKIVDDLTKHTNIIQTNPISEHYDLANSIIEESNNLDSGAALASYSISELLQRGYSVEDITNIANQLK